MKSRDHRRRWGASLAAGFLVATLALTGCSASQTAGSSSGGAAPANGAQRAPGAGAPAAGAGAAGAAGPQAQSGKTDTAPTPGSTPASPNAAAANRAVIYSGEIQLRSAHVDAAVQQAQSLVQSVGGYVDSEQVGNAGTMPWFDGAPATGVQQPSDGSTPAPAGPSLPLASPTDASGEAAILVLRVPTAAYDQVYEQLSSLGAVLARERTSQDVTEQVVDLDARVATEKTSIDRLKSLMGQAGSLNDILTLEQAISQRESDLNSLESQVASLRGQVAMSTVTVQLFQTATPPPPPAKPTPQGAWGAAGHALAAGWHALYLVGRGILIVVSATLPFLAVLAILAFGVYRFARPRRKDGNVERSADE